MELVLGGKIVAKGFDLAVLVSLTRPPQSVPSRDVASREQHRVRRFVFDVSCCVLPLRACSNDFFFFISFWKNVESRVCLIGPTNK